jgi:UDP-glucose 4-epimerase
MRILITGSTGFIGGSVGRFAARSGHEVMGIARRSQPEVGWTGSHAAADVAVADLAAIIQEFKPDAIFHGAGAASVSASMDSPLDDLRAAAMTWANLLDSVRRSKLRPMVVFPSSAAVYGNPPGLPVHEKSVPHPISPYGFHKLACELIAREYATCFGVDSIVCRIFSVLGSAQRRLLVWEIFEKIHSAQESIFLFGTGNESRDYLHVDDLASAVLALVDATPRNDEAICRVFNLASGTETRIADLAREMVRLTGSSKPIQYSGQLRRGDPARWCADMATTHAVIPAWKPRSLTASLEQCVAEWQLAEPGLSRSASSR